MGPRAFRIAARRFRPRPQLIVDKCLNHVSADRSTIAGVYDRHSYWREKSEALNLWASNLSAILAGQEPGRNVIPLRRAG
jgi:hypothetical protein